MATVYIAPTAQGSADGTSATNAYAYSSLGSAETDAGNGGTILFLDGTYNLGTETWDAGGAADMTFKSLNDHGAYLVGTSYIKIGSSTTDTFKVEGFASANLTYMVNHSSNSTVTTLNNIKHIDTSSSTKSGLGAIYSYSNDAAISITNSSFCLDYSGSSLLFGNKFGNTSVDACSFFIKCSSVSANGITSGTTPLTIKNTIFASDTASAIAASAIDTSDCTNCCIHQMNSTSHTSGGTDNVYADPKYVDTSTGDLRLRPSSPCIGAATTS
jgi:hypothetical protein